MSYALASFHLSAVPVCGLTVPAGMWSMHIATLVSCFVQHLPGVSYLPRLIGQSPVFVLVLLPALCRVEALEMMRARRIHSGGTG
jgi:hypothetical protein